jgi:hypothetical protein
MLGSCGAPAACSHCSILGLVLSATCGQHFVSQILNQLGTFNRNVLQRGDSGQAEVGATQMTSSLPPFENKDTAVSRNRPTMLTAKPLMPSARAQAADTAHVRPIARRCDLGTEGG